VASRDGIALEAGEDYELKGVTAAVKASKLRWRELAAQAPGRGGEDDAPPDEPEDNAIAPAAIRLPPVLAAYAEEPLIGREREISVLREATAAGEGRRAVLILGEPGIGKTRQAAAAAADAHAQGALVVLARCPPEAVIAFEPWVRAIAELSRAGDDAWRREFAAAAGPELRALVPGLGGEAAAPAVGVGDVVAAEGARYRLLHGIGSALAFAAGEAPLHVVLDDAHWCDAASAQALEHLLDSTPSARMVLIVTARECEMGRGHPVSRVLSDLRRTGNLDELRLGGLDAGGMAALVAARVGRAITPRLAARLQARTAGNPFFAAELARDLEERGALGEGEALDSAPVPDAVTDLVEERLARLDPLTERLLAAVAAIGPSAPVGLAARAAGIGEQELLAADLFRARQAFRGAVEAARVSGDGGTIARAALGFAGGDISFGIETNSYDALAVELLREGLDALGESEPRLALRMSFRLCFALIYSDDEAVLDALVMRAKKLDRELDDAESHVLAHATEALALAARSRNHLTMFAEVARRFLEVNEMAEKCDREDLRFRIVLWSAFSFYSLGRIAECEAAIEQAAAIAQRLGSPRFTWEIDYIRGQRLLDRGDRAGAEVLVHRAGKTLRAPAARPSDGGGARIASRGGIGLRR
jgi:hypothetical protein